MKTIKQIWKEVNVRTGQEIEEDAPANAAGGGAIAGLGVDHPDYPGSGEPGVDPWQTPGVFPECTRSPNVHSAKAGGSGYLQQWGPGPG